MSFLIRPDTFFQLDSTVADTSVTRWAAKLVGHKAKTFFSYGVTKQMIYQDKPAIGPTIFYRNYTSYVAGRITGEELVVKTAQLLDVPSDRIDLQSVIHAAICVGRVIGYSAFSMIPYMATHPTVVSLIAACGVRFLLAAMSEIEGGDYKLYPGFPVQLIDRSVKDVTCTVFLVAVENGYVRPRMPVREVSKAQRDNAVIVAHGVFRNELIRRTAALRSEGFVLTPVQQDMETLVATRLADFLNKTDDISCFFNRIEKEEYFDKTMYSIATVTDGKWTIDYIPMYFDEFTMKGYVEWPCMPNESGFLTVSEMTNEAHVAGSSMLTNVESRSLPNAAMVSGVMDFFKTKSGYVVERRTDDMAADLAVAVARSVCKCGDVDKAFPGKPPSSEAPTEIVCNEVIVNAPLRTYRDTKHEVAITEDNSRDVSENVVTPVVESQQLGPPASTHIDSVGIETPVVESRARFHSESAQYTPDSIIIPAVASQAEHRHECAIAAEFGDALAIAESGLPSDVRPGPDVKNVISMWKRTRPRTDDSEFLKNMSLKELRMLANEFVAYGSDDLDSCDTRLILYCGMNIPATAQSVYWKCISFESGTFVTSDDAACKYAAPGSQFCGRLFLLKKGLTGDPLLKRRSGIKFVMHRFVNERLGYEYVPHALKFETVDDTAVSATHGRAAELCGCVSRGFECQNTLGEQNGQLIIGWHRLDCVGLADACESIGSGAVIIRSRYMTTHGRRRDVYGRGFAIGAYIITAAHVVKDNVSAYVTCIDRGWSDADAYVVGMSVEKDIAVLSVFSRKPGSDTLVRITEKIPHEVEHACDEPLFSHVCDEPITVISSDSTCILINKTFTYGYSGMPLTTLDGRIMAIYVGALVDPDNGHQAGLAVRISRSLLRDICKTI